MEPGTEPDLNGANAGFAPPLSIKGVPPQHRDQSGKPLPLPINHDIQYSTSIMQRASSVVLRVHANALPMPIDPVLLEQSIAQQKVQQPLFNTHLLSSPQSLPKAPPPLQHMPKAVRQPVDNDTDTDTSSQLEDEKEDSGSSGQEKTSGEDSGTSSGEELEQVSLNHSRKKANRTHNVHMYIRGTNSNSAHNDRQISCYEPHDYNNPPNDANSYDPDDNHDLQNFTGQGQHIMNTNDPLLRMLCYSDVFGH